MLGSTLAACKATATFPPEDRYGLTSQIRRPCSSIPANTAERCGGIGDVELARSLGIASDSDSELEYHLPFAHDLNLLETAEYREPTGEVTEVKPMLTAFSQRLKADG